jgi:CheY-like chemotaxis protein
MRGEVTLDSLPGEGSTFTVRLPLERAARPLPAPVESLSEPFANNPGLRILVAEDNAMNQLVLKTLLGQLGFELSIVENGEEAVRAWEDGAWHVILMDIQMPVMDGPTATRLIREREREDGLPRTPIIALTANAMSHHAEEYRAAGMDALVAKPIRVAELLQAIESVCAAAEGDPQARRPSAGGTR